MASITFNSDSGIEIPETSDVRNDLATGFQKRYRCIEQSFGLCGRGRGWDGLGEWH